MRGKCVSMLALLMLSVLSHTSYAGDQCAKLYTTNKSVTSKEFQTAISELAKFKTDVERSKAQENGTTPSQNLERHFTKRMSELSQLTGKSTTEIALLIRQKIADLQMLPNTEKEVERERREKAKESVALLDPVFKFAREYPEENVSHALFDFVDGDRKIAYLVQGADNQSYLKLKDVETGKNRIFSDAPLRVKRAQTFENSKKILFVTSDGSLVTFDTTAMKFVSRVPFPAYEDVLLTLNKIAISPNQKLAAFAGSSEAIVVEIATGKLLQAGTNAKGSRSYGINTLTFLSDAEILFNGSNDSNQGLFHRLEISSGKISELNLNNGTYGAQPVILDPTARTLFLMFGDHWQRLDPQTLTPLTDAKSVYNIGFRSNYTSGVTLLPGSDHFFRTALNNIKVANRVDIPRIGIFDSEGNLTETDFTDRYSGDKIISQIARDRQVAFSRDHKTMVVYKRVTQDPKTPSSEQSTIDVWVNKGKNQGLKSD